VREPLPDEARPGSQDVVTTRVQLLGAAAACLSERGFELTRLRDVAKRAGVSIGLLQHYFETRDGLLREAFSWSCAELIERSRDRARSSSAPWERIVSLLDALLTDPGLKRHARANEITGRLRTPPAGNR
jgi:AcrR family transcriptional regulator